MLKAGRRFPYFSRKLSSGKNIYDLLSPDGFQLFIFDCLDENVESNIDASIHSYRFSRDEEQELFEHYKIESGLLVLVRPDMYIACVANEVKDINIYLQKMVIQTH